MTSIISSEGVVLRISDDESRLAVPDDERSDVTVAAVGPTGVDVADPLVTVTSGARTAVHTRCSQADLDEVLAGIDDGDLPTDVADDVVDHEAGIGHFPVPDLPGFESGVREVLGGCGWRRPTSSEDHEAAGGFTDADPSTVRDVAGDLRGRGWGDWSRDEPLVGTWETAREAAGDAAVVVNAHGTAAESLLLASVPFEVLDGAQAAAGTVEADSIVVYVSEADDRAVDRVREAIANYPDPPVPMDVVVGPPEYRGGEPTMALEAIEGNHRLEARLRPPGPAEVGLHGRPTLVHTARTFAQLAVALRTGALPETRLVTVMGDVAEPTTVELHESDSLDATLAAVDVEGEVKAACVGGRFGGLTASLDISPDPDTLDSAGLGTEGIVEVLAENRCIVEFVGKRAQFASETNCGRCVPCREGTTQLAELLRDIYDGDYERGKLAELERVMRTSSICEFGVQAGRPTRTAMAEFEHEFEAHADGRCPAGVCTQLEATP